MNLMLFVVLYLHFSRKADDNLHKSETISIFAKKIYDDYKAIGCRVSQSNKAALRQYGFDEESS